MESLPEFVTFADGSKVWRATGRRLGRQAKKSGYFSKVSVLNAGDLKCSSSEHTHDPNLRGFDFWRWKPEVILQTLDSMSPTCPGVWYIDAGCTVFATEASKKRMMQYSAVAEQNGWGLAFHLDNNFSDARYSKALVLDHFGVSIDDAATGQVQATAIFIRNNQAGKSLARAWYEAALVPELFDDSNNNSRKGPEELSFVGHRHDQAVFSALVKSRSLATLPDELNMDRRLLLGLKSVPFPIVATRHRSRFSSLSMNPVLRMVRLVERLLR